jgi:hypothetical protein
MSASKMETSTKNSKWDYRVPEPTIPWSSRAPNPHDQHLNGQGLKDTTEMMAIDLYARRRTS